MTSPSRLRLLAFLLVSIISIPTKYCNPQLSHDWLHGLLDNDLDFDHAPYLTKAVGISPTLVPTTSINSKRPTSAPSQPYPFYFIVVEPISAVGLTAQIWDLSTTSQPTFKATLGDVLGPSIYVEIQSVMNSPPSLSTYGEYESTISVTYRVYFLSSSVYSSLVLSLNTSLVSGAFTVLLDYYAEEFECKILYNSSSSSANIGPEQLTSPPKVTYSPTVSDAPLSSLTVDDVIAMAVSASVLLLVVVGATCYIGRKQRADMAVFEDWVGQTHMSEATANNSPSFGMESTPYEAFEEDQNVRSSMTSKGGRMSMSTLAGLSRVEEGSVESNLEMGSSSSSGAVRNPVNNGIIEA